MTEQSKFLTQTEPLRPSILDYVAHVGLNSLFDPILRRIVHRLADQYKQWKTVRDWFDEYFTLLNILVQFYFLKNYCATLSEKFYGLQRKPVGGGGKLGVMELVLSLLAETVFPYILIKLRNLSDKIVFDELPKTHKTGRTKLMKFVLNVNSGVNIILHLFTFIQLLRYLGERTDYMCPGHWFARVKLVYSNDALFEEVGFKNIVPNFVARSVELCAFMAQFFHLWKESDMGNFNFVPIPPPPKKCSKALPLASKCPLCHKARKIDTVLTISGFVFCFECITKYLVEYKQCPVTKLPATVDHLVRVRTTV